MLIMFIGIGKIPLEVVHKPNKIIGEHSFDPENSLLGLHPRENKKYTCKSISCQHCFIKKVTNL